jgi:hypothetical protein
VFCITFEEEKNKKAKFITSVGKANEPNPARPNPGRHILVYTRPLWDVSADVFALKEK